ncbi:MAG: LysE family translocator, partial [Kangiellaceae bacterium]
MFPSLETILLVLSAGFALAATPGPSMLYVLSRSIEQDYKAGFASSAGMAIGGMFHAIIAATGIASVIILSPTLYSSIKYAGAIYLLYLGFNMLKHNIKLDEVSLDLKSKEELDTKLEKNKMTYKKIFVQGMLVELSNPKTI